MKIKQLNKLEYENFFGKHYMLTGITVHSGGGTGGGHYISKVRPNDSNFFFILFKELNISS